MTDCVLFIILLLSFPIPNLYSQTTYQNWPTYTDSLIEEGKETEAISYLQDMINHYEKEETWEEIIYGYHKLAYLTLNEASLTYAKKSLSLTQKAFPDDITLLALSHKEVGMSAYDLHLTKESLFHIQESKNLFLRLTEEFEVAWAYLPEILLTEAQNYFELKNWQSTAQTILEALDIINQKLDGEHYLKGNLYNLQGLTYERQGYYESALSSFKKALDNVEEGQEKFEITCYNNISLIYRKKADLDRAYDFYYHALNLLNKQENKDTVLLIELHKTLGYVYTQKEEYDKAIYYLNQALDYLALYSGRISINTQTSIYNHLALAWMGKDPEKDVLPFLNQALNIHQKSSDFIEITWTNLSRAFREKRQFSKARNYHLKAINRFRQNYGNHHPEIAKGYRHLGWMKAEEQKWYQALNFYQKSLGVIAKGFNDEKGFSNPAIHSVQDFAQLFFILQNKGLTLKELGKKEKDQDLLNQSLDTYKLASEVVDSMLYTYHEGSKKFWLKKIRPIYEQAIGVAVDLYWESENSEYLHKAFYFAERSRAVLLRESLRESIARQQTKIDPSIIQKEKQFNIDLSFYRKQIFQEEAKGQAADTTKILIWRSHIFNLRDSISRIKAISERKLKAYLSEENNISLSAIQSNLSDSTLLLEYVIGDSASYIFAIDNQTVKVHLIDKNLKTDLSLFINNLKNRNQVEEEGMGFDFFKQFTIQSFQLYNSLLKPVFSESYQDLIIIPDGILGYLPFEVLVTEQKEEKEAQTNYRKTSFLVSKADVRYEYSASLLKTLKSNSKPEKGFAGFAPVYSQQFTSETRDGNNQCGLLEAYTFADLLNNRIEVQAIADLLSGRSFKGKKATEKTFLNVAPESQILHLAMHGFINDCDPLYSGLAFSKDSEKNIGNFVIDSVNPYLESDNLLYAYEIYNLSLKANLTVLSACNTGSGKAIEGEGIMSLGRAFKYAGCPNIVMSLWQADDKSTAFIMEAFYRQLKAGVGKAEALRLAKEEYVAKHKFSHPFFWGGFILIGDDQEMELNQEGWSGYFYILGFLVFGILVFVFYWKMNS